ncbi:tetratricopeptide repeat protein [Argonema galeatum]|uniref:tetratricopeptide repeat protein n=1 Tax=Argonema galeatum TaxID=2942762 RepID=UPI0020127CD7|nr:tetratricopeptide repeat protein [Argonema galeatum]MCL1464616.1 tetratricopeptide repeat protein [Argonema galeatum A003/A1]
MAKVDLTILEERTNLFSFLRDLYQICSGQNEESDRSFQLLYRVWEKTSGKLWFLGYWNDYFRCGNIVLKSAKAVNNMAIEAQLLSEMGWVCMEWEDFATTEKFFNESLHLYELLENPRGKCRLMRYLGVLSHRQQQLNSALEHYRRALEVVSANCTSSSANDNWAFHEAELPNVLGELYLELQDFSASYPELKQSLERYTSLINRYRYYQADPLLNLGRWHFLQGEYDRARQYYQDCLQLSQEISRPDTIAGVLLRLAELAEVEGKTEEALQLASEAERVAGTEIPSVREEAARFREKLLIKYSLNNV